MVAYAVAQGTEPGSALLYASYLYYGDTLEIVSIDPSTGRVIIYPNPVRGEFGARSIARGPDGNLYLGTLPRAHLLRLEARTGKLVDLGRPSSTEEYIWDLAFARDGRLYGATYPHAKLIRLDPESGKMDDLGRMDDSEMYAHYVAAGPDDFVYVGIGTRRMGIVAYNVTTGEHRELLPPSARATGQGVVFTGSDRRAYGIAGDRHFRLDGWTATPIEKGKLPARSLPNRTEDGRILAIRGNETTATDQSSGRVTAASFAYPGRPLPLFRVGIGPDGILYGSSIVPAQLVRLDPSRGALEVLGDLGPGEVFTFLSGRGRLLMGTYACLAPLMSFDPQRPFKIDGTVGNPSLVTFPRSDPSWRPVSSTWGPDGRAYVGAIGGYGKLGGQLVAWDVESGGVEELTVVPAEMGVTALASVGTALVVGTTINGGGGSVPSRIEASVLVWDPGRKRLLHSFVPVPGAPTIENLVTAPDGAVYGIAGGRLFVVDPTSWRLTSTSPLAFRAPTVPGSLSVARDGRIWGLAAGDAGGVFTIDPTTHSAALVGRAPEPITGGAASTEDSLYFTSGAALYRFALPRRSR